MYAGIAIDNFKGFGHFEITGFRRVNIITGRNNAGKTALLEALFIHSGGANAALPFITESFRGIPRLEGAMEAVLGALFTNFDTAKTITLAATDQLGLKTTCTLGLVPAPTVVTPSFTVGQSALGGASLPGTTSSESSGASSPNMALQQTFRESDSVFTTRAVFEGNVLRIEPPPRGPHYLGIIIPARFLDQMVIAERFGALSKSVGVVEKFVETMKVIEPRLRDLRLITHAGIPMVHADIGLQRFLPLAHVGEGMSRLAAILVAIAVIPNGVLMIDEFESGFHFSVLPSVWRAVHTFAEEYRVQVFATTHSEECLRAAHEAFKDEQSQMATFRLAQRDGRIEAKLFDWEALAAALKSGLETR